MKISILSLLVLAAIVVLTAFSGCKKDIDDIDIIEDVNQNIFDEPMPEELLQFFESCPVAQYTDINDFDFSDIGLKKAEVQSPLVPLLREMAIKAIFLTDRSNFKKPADADSVNQPKQNGLAYTYGRKDYEKRMVGMDKSVYDKKKQEWVVTKKNECTEALFGLDCSGFIYHVLKAAQITIPTGRAIDQIQKLQKLTEIKNNPYYNGKIKIEEKQINEGFNSDSLRSGDIIYKQISSENIPHIGIILKRKDGTVVIFHSIGSYDVPCSTNKDERHGPIQSVLADDTVKKYFGNFSGQAHILRFIDKEEHPPIITIEKVTNKTSTSAELNGNLIIIGNSPIKSCGFCWDTMPYPTIDKSNKNQITIGENGKMSSNIIDLKPNKQYFVRAYGKMASSTVHYSDEISFTTSDVSAIPITISNITYSSAVANLKINPSSIGLQSSETISLIGVCYGLSPKPTKTVYANYSSSTTTYKCTLPDLLPGKKYFVRGYVRTSAGKDIYGDEVEFTTERGLAGTTWDGSIYGVNPNDNCYLTNGPVTLDFIDDINVSFSSIGYGTYTLTGNKIDIDFGSVEVTGTLSNSTTPTMSGSGKHITTSGNHKFNWMATKQ